MSLLDDLEAINTSNDSKSAENTIYQYVQSVFDHPEDFDLPQMTRIYSTKAIARIRAQLQKEYDELVRIENDEENRILSNLKNTSKFFRKTCLVFFEHYKIQEIIHINQSSNNQRIKASLQTYGAMTNSTALIKTNSKKMARTTALRGGIFNTPGLRSYAFNYLGLYDLMRASQVNHHWHNLISDKLKLLNGLDIELKDLNELRQSEKHIFVLIKLNAIFGEIRNQPVQLQAQILKNVIHYIHENILSIPPEETLLPFPLNSSTQTSEEMNEEKSAEIILEIDEEKTTSPKIIYSDKEKAEQAIFNDVVRAILTLYGNIRAFTPSTTQKEIEEIQQLFQTKLKETHFYLQYSIGGSLTAAEEGADIRLLLSILNNNINYPYRSKQYGVLMGLSVACMFVIPGFAFHISDSNTAALVGGVGFAIALLATIIICIKYAQLRLNREINLDIHERNRLFNTGRVAQRQIQQTLINPPLAEPLLPADNGHSGNAADVVHGVSLGN